MSEVDPEVLKAVGKTLEEYESFGEASDDDVSLTETVDACIEAHISGDDDGESERHKPRIGVYHASGTTGCIRKRWYGTKGIKERDRDKFPTGIGFRGDLVEDEVEESLIENIEENLADELEEEMREHLESGLQVGNEYPVSACVDEWDHVGEFYITGSTDPFIEDANGHLLEVVEVKSAGSIPDEPKWKHKFQLNTYLSVLGLDTGTIVYINPSNWDKRHAFTYEQDPGLWHLTKLLNAIFHMYRKDDELPPKTPMAEDECKWCRYKGFCARDSRAEGWEEENFPPDHRDTEERTNHFKEF